MSRMLRIQGFFILFLFKDKKETMKMNNTRSIEIFSAGCPACDEAIEMVKRNTCPSCEINVLDMNDPAVANRAKSLDIRSVPAVVIDGKLADCCSGRGPDEATLKAAGLGQPLS
jgi:glutaredoxin 3